jgi:uncharacterized membrane protein
VTNVTVGVSAVIDANGTQYSGLTIPGVSTSSTGNSGTFTVSGDVLNNGDETTGTVWVVATFYDASGTVVGLNVTDYLSNSLAPRDSVPFTATPTDNTAQLSSEIANYSLLVQFDPLTASEGSSPSGFSSPQPMSSSATSTRPAQSPLLSSVLIYAAASAIVVIVVVLASLLVHRKRKKNAEFELLPPPPPPQPSP